MPSALPVMTCKAGLVVVVVEVVVVEETVVLTGTVLVVVMTVVLTVVEVSALPQAVKTKVNNKVTINSQPVFFIINAEPPVTKISGVSYYPQLWNIL
jgi:hypothetical protein